VSQRAVFLDRDGVLIRTDVRDGVPHPVAGALHVEILPGVAEALAALAAHELLLVGVTNQPDVTRGTTTRETVDGINRRLLADLPLREIRTCFHDDADGCACRKPRPGLLVDAARAHDIDLARSFMVGDRWSDVAAGEAAGCLTFLLDVPYNQRLRCRPDHVVPGLPDAARIILDLVQSADSLEDRPR
jgi:D-glycero-D-manno-heptose 1,7-bisphosphate phosphatase